MLNDPVEGIEGNAGRVWLGPLPGPEFLASIKRGAWVDKGILIEVETPEGLAVWRVPEGFN